MAETYIVNVEGAVWRSGRYMLIVRGPEEAHAAGTLSLVGGKVEVTEGGMDDVLETTLRREIREEVGLVIGETVYVHSTHFTAAGQNVIDVVFLGRYESGEPLITDPGEVAEIRWLTAAEVLDHPAAPPWTKGSIERVEQVRNRLNWS
jgi:NADH pyrophosphatase NudC (nudix superfamily)